MADMTHARRVDANRLAEEYFDSLMIRYRYIGSAEPSTAYSLYGRSFRTPILCGPLAYMALNRIHVSGRPGLAKGLDDAGSGMISAWISDDELKSLVDAGFRVARSIKPFADHGRVLRLIEASEKLGAFAVCIDIDHCFSGGKEKRMKTGWIVKRRGGEGFFFDLLAPDGLLLCRSPLYAEEAECLAAIGLFRERCAAEDAGCEISETQGGYTFFLPSPGGGVLAQGPEFAAEYSCRKGVAQMLQYAPSAELIVPTHMGAASTGQAFRG